MLDAGLPQVGIAVHWSDAALLRGPVWPRARLTAEALAQLEQNAVYTFTRR